MTSGLGRTAKVTLFRCFVYGVLSFWAFVSLFPVYWTVTTSFKNAAAITQQHLIPWLTFQPSWMGWRAWGLSPETIFGISPPRDQLISRLINSAIVALGASLLALVLGSCAAYGLSRFRYKFGPMKNKDLMFFFISQLILPPVVLALPFLVLYRELVLLDTSIGLIFIYTLTVMPIVIWVMRDQFDSIPAELDDAGQMDGLSVWGVFAYLIVPIALPGMVAAFLLSLVLAWNEYFFASLLTSTDAKTITVMVYSQTSSPGLRWWNFASLTTVSIAPLVIVGVILERYIVKGLSTGAVK